MSAFFWAGTFLGAVIGFFHLFIIVSARSRLADPQPLKSVWQGLWVWALWTIFGAYILALWVLGALLLLGSRIFGIGRAER